jgi:hypothetical protein
MGMHGPSPCRNFESISLGRALYDGVLEYKMNSKRGLEFPVLAVLLLLFVCTAQTATNTAISDSGGFFISLRLVTPFLV